MSITSNNFKADFIGIGAEKAGTTWIADCLAEHPEVCFSREKELFFFNEYDPHWLRVKNEKFERAGMNWYKKQFAHCGPGMIRGEYSPTYLYDRAAARRIKAAFPEIKLLVTLREPLTRAFSQFIHDRRIGLIKKIGFEEALAKYDSYMIKSNYAEHLACYYSLFPAKQIMVMLFDDIKERPRATIKKIYEFLALKNTDYEPSPLWRKSNEAGYPKFENLNYFMIHLEYYLKQKRLYRLHSLLESSGIRRLAVRLRDINSKPLGRYPAISGETKRRLKKIFHPDILETEKLIGRDLSAWIEN